MAAQPAVLPEDPATSIPAAVRQGAARADAAHKAAYPSDPAGDPPAPAAAPAAPAPAAPAPAPPAADDPSWENRFKALKGRFDGVNNENTQLRGDMQRMTDRMSGMEAMLARMQTPEPTQDPALRAASLLTPEERANYGEEFMEVVAKRAREALQPELDARDATIDSLRKQVTGVTSVVAGVTREQMFERLDAELPNWREVNIDPGFLQWLRLPDAFSGVTRQKLLTSAFEQNDSLRVQAFFKGFLAEEAAVAPVPESAPASVEPARPGLEAFAAPGRAKSAAATPQGGSPEKPIILRTQISQFYADVRANKYAGKEAEKDRLEAMIFAAEKEGRIR